MAETLVWCCWITFLSIRLIFESASSLSVQITSKQELDYNRGKTEHRNWSIKQASPHQDSQGAYKSGQKDRRKMTTSTSIIDIKP
ncbi:hypothetical protein RRG08_055124 [Elysia crispata]|uniref:Secreted protein n=1 Tax=Elysia crispata TaxID=231223 RepID=A0AAE1E1X9_9GAST|nr:hypothetical protein RRG08_055124 [Elysia crispata]